MADAAAVAAAAAAAALLLAGLPPPAAPLTMIAYLEHTLGVANQTMREKMIRHGFNNPTTLVKKDQIFVSKICTMIRRATGGATGC